MPSTPQPFSNAPRGKPATPTRATLARELAIGPALIALGMLDAARKMKGADRASYEAKANAILAKARETDPTLPM